MRGLENLVKGAVFIAGVIAMSASVAQSKDPQVFVYFDNVAVCKNGWTPTFTVALNSTTGLLEQRVVCAGPDPAPVATYLELVTRSRTGYDTRAAYDIAITNNTTNSLNRLYFRVRANTLNTDGTTSASNAKFEKIVFTAPTPFTCYENVTDKKGNTTTKTTPLAVPYNVSDMTCTSQISLAPKSTSGTTTVWATQGVTVVALTPAAGDNLFVDAWVGGYEGSSDTGQGCCAEYKSPQLTTLIDQTVGDYTLNTTTFLTADQPGLVITGNGVASRTDLLATNVKAPKIWTNSTAKYDIGTVVEKSFPEGTGRCKQSKLKYCQESTISLPNVEYTPPAATDTSDVCSATEWQDKLLEIVLTLDASLVKGNVANLDLVQDIKVSYRDTATSAPRSVAPCSNTIGADASIRFPCLCGADLINNGKTIRYWLKNFKNGSFNFD